VPVYEEGDLKLFESGAIVMHLGERCPALLPLDPVERARARTWMFAALNSVEPHVQNLVAIDLFFANEDWARQRRPGAEKMVQSRLDGALAAYQARCEARPAFQRALTSQLAPFERYAPAA
jgi:glutathione S-transferase